VRVKINHEEHEGHKEIARVRLALRLLHKRNLADVVRRI
jgi:hypothetical protein